MLDPRLEEELKRAPAGTREALVAFQTNYEPEQLEIFARGILARNIDDEYLEVLENATDETRFSDDLGIDSLTMAEIAMTFEDALGIELVDDELKSLRTFGDIKKHLLERVRSGGAA